MNDDLDCQVTEASRAAKYSRFDGYKIGYLDGLKDALEEISDDSDSASMLGAVIVAGFACPSCTRRAPSFPLIPIDVSFRSPRD